MKWREREGRETLSRSAGDWQSKKAGMGIEKLGKRGEGERSTSHQVLWEGTGPT